ncbi:MAG: hypothetical protein J5J00_06360 [Deltaproteobacteria bacterium]|nr:hypothetical protein [Deltaproteobacteria bacterium]
MFEYSRPIRGEPSLSRTPYLSSTYFGNGGPGRNSQSSDPTESATPHNVIAQLSITKALGDLVENHKRSTLWGSSIQVSLSEMTKIAAGYAPHQLREASHLRDLIFADNYKALTQLPLDVVAGCVALRERSTLQLLNDLGVSEPYLCGFEAAVRDKLSSSMMKRSWLLNGSQMSSMLINNFPRVLHLGNRLEGMGVSPELQTALRSGFDYSFLRAVPRADDLIEMQVFETSNKVRELFESRYRLMRDELSAAFNIGDREMQYLDTYYMEPRLLLEQDAKTRSWVEDSAVPEFNLRLVRSIVEGMILDRLGFASPEENENAREVLDIARQEAWLSIYWKRTVNAGIRIGGIGMRAAQVGMGLRFW